ncbi:hypothetical protein AB9E85_06125 [Escherichia coli]|uniref:hypothetical protein n=1 Tax=Escherichia coli TaxID=562 RepID=UPI0038B53C43
MRKSLVSSAVALLTGIHLLFVPFQPVPAVRGVILTVAFILINFVAQKVRLWRGTAWLFVAGIIMTVMLKGDESGDEIRVMITIFAFLTSAWFSVVQYRKEKHFRS